MVLVQTVASGQNRQKENSTLYRARPDRKRLGKITKKKTAHYMELVQTASVWAKSPKRKQHTISCSSRPQASGQNHQKENSTLYGARPDRKRLGFYSIR
jgi:hypothetical protein